MNTHEWLVEAGAFIQELKDNPSVLMVPELVYVMVSFLDENIPDELHGDIVEYRAQATENAWAFLRSLGLDAPSPDASPDDASDADGA